MKTNVREYTDTELLSKVKALPSYNGRIPNYLLIVVRSQEDEPNVFDDKTYLFLFGKCVKVTSCTSNSGTPSLLGGWKKSNGKGTAVIKSQEIYYDALQKTDGVKVRHHQGKMMCLRQIAPFKYFRDNDNDNKSEEIGNIEVANNSTNFHFNSYDFTSKAIKWIVGAWSEGCIVCNILQDYLDILNLVPLDVKVSLALLKED